MNIQYTTVVGLPVDFKKDSENNCNNCSYKVNKWFNKKKNNCKVILGLTVDSDFGRCSLYEKCIIKE